MQLELIESTKKGDRVWTPDWVVQDMVQHFKPTGTILEPFKGAGAFLRCLPAAAWCEIDEGRDFFKFCTQVDWVMTNPPFSIMRDCWRHAARIAEHIVFLVPLRNFFAADGFMREIFAYGGMPECRIYGTGGKLGFPMGNCIGAIHTQRGYGGDMRWSIAKLQEPQPGEQK